MTLADRLYALLYQRLLSPLHEGMKGRTTMARRRFLEQSQWWPRERLLAFQRGERTALLRHAAEQVPYWQERFAALRMRPQDLTDDEAFCRLPILTKEDIRAHRPQMLARSFSGKTWAKATGGSTGAPLQFDYTPESYAWRVAATKRGYGWAGCEDGLKQAYIWGVAIGDVPRLTRLKENAHHWLIRQRYFNCFEFDEPRMASCLQALNRYRPDYLVGYTNPLCNFAEFIRREGGRRFAPKAVITGAEKLHDFQRATLREVFGCPVFNTYGSREFMLIASECREHRGLHVNAENLVVDIVRDDGRPAGPGETGRVVITDLHNYGMPFIRYEIGDLGVASEAACPCGRGLPLLTDVVGRSLDMIKTPDGRFVPGEFFPHLMKEFSGVRRFQVVQRRLDRLAVKLVKDGQFQDRDLDMMRREIRKTLGPAVDVEFQFVDDIPLTRTGKFRVTVSELS